MYRAYPAPSQPPGGGMNTQRPSGQGGAPSAPPPRGQGEQGSVSSSNRAMPPPGLANPMPSPTKSVAPPSKKQRALPSNLCVPPYKSTTDEITKLADEGIARRRDEIKKMQSHRSTTADLLARARAVTSKGSHLTNPPSTRLYGSLSSHTTATGMNTGGVDGGIGMQAYAARTRPLSLPKSPVRQRPFGAPPSQDATNISNVNAISNAPAPLSIPGAPKQVPAINTTFNNNEEANKPRTSPNQKVAVQTPFLPANEASKITPITNITTSTAPPPISPQTAAPPAGAPPKSHPTMQQNILTNAPPQPMPPTHLPISNGNHTIQKDTQNNNVPPLTTEQSKRETLKSLRNIAQSPSVPPNSTMIQSSNISDNNNKESSSHSKIMKELLEAKTLRENALKQVAQLEKEVMNLRLERERHSNQVQETMIGQDRSRSMNRSPVNRKRMKSPMPTNRTKNDRNSNPLADYDIACRAVETVEDVYSSDLGMYVVRKPYGGNENMEYAFPPSCGANENDCNVSWYEPVNSYIERANVQEEASIEVLARIGADNSVLLLHGTSCRHGTAVLGAEGNIVGYEWKYFNDIETMDGSLGKIIYIDVYGNDGEYWLDSIYEEVLKIRENFCSNVFSAALALKVSSPEPNNNGFFQHGSTNHNPPQQPPMPTTETVDACVGTADDFPQHQEPPKMQTGAAPPKQHSAQKLDPKAVEEDLGSADALSTFIMFFGGTITSIIWYFLLLPIRVMKFTVFVSLVFWLISMIWLYFADDNGALALGAGIDYHLNPPGIR